MPYKLNKYEWDLTEEEQEQARYIKQDCEEKSHDWIMKGSGGSRGLDYEAFVDFKYRFYSSACRRLEIRTGFLGIVSDKEGFSQSCFSISDDCTKLVAYRIDKVKTE